MPIQLVSIGPPIVLTQNVVYALPARQCLLTTSAACEVSTNGTNWVSHTSGTVTGSAFIRSAGVNTTITAKRP